MRIDRRDDDWPAVESEVQVCERRKRAQEEAGCHDEHQRQRDLPDDQRVSERETALAHHTTALLLERIVRLHLRRAERGDGAEEHCGRDCNRGREQEHPPVEREVQEHGVRRCGQLAHEQPAEPLGKDQPEQRTKTRKEEALGQELAGEHEPRCAERQPDAHLVSTRSRACEQEIGDVRAGDEQNETDDDHDGREWPLISAAERRGTARGGIERQRFLQVRSLVVLAPVLRHRGLTDLRMNSLQGLVGFGDRLGRTQPGHDGEPPGRPAIERALLASNQRLGPQRNRDVERSSDVEPEEPGRGDGHDRERHPLDGDRPADHVGSAAEPALPEAVTDDGDRTIGSAAPSVVGAGPGPAEDRRNAQHIEEVSRRPDSVDELGLSALCEVESRGRTSERAVVELGPIADRLPDGVRPPPLAG